MTEPDKKSCDGGIVHTYLGYDPQRFPMPDAEAPDLVTPAFEHMLAYGNLRDLTDQELADAIELDPSQITGMGPSLSALLAMLEERKRKILETYETNSVRDLAARNASAAAQGIAPPKEYEKRFRKAAEGQQLADLERLWHEVDELGRRASLKLGLPTGPATSMRDFGRQLVPLMECVGARFEIEQLAAKYRFTGKREMDVPKALEIKEELETIDRLIEQLKQAAKDAKIYVINMEELGRFADEEQMESIQRLRQQVEEMMRHLAEEQGLQNDGKQFSLTPKAFKLFQSKLLDRIFADLQAGKTGRHQMELTGDGAVEMQRTKPYEFGDSLANMDVAGTLQNAILRESREKSESRNDLPPTAGVRLKPEDIEIHLTRNAPKCATMVCMDMSGSMRWGGQYINVKRMALALHGLIRKDYPGDFVDFVEICTLPKRRHISEVPSLLPKPVTTQEPWVRLKADMSDDRISERDIHPHFTNIQHGLALSRRILQVQDTPNRQIILITDGLPTAHFEDKWLYMLYPPDRRTEHFTLREGLLCRDQGITINIFLLSSWAQSEEDIKFANRLAEGTQGRVFYVSGGDLDRFVVWDYLQRRRFIVG